jgi:hypothetical protein
VVNAPGAEITSYALGGPDNDPRSISPGPEHAREWEITASAK